MISKKMQHNAHKFAFFVETYPEHTVAQIIAILEMPAIDINCAIWAATELGIISEPDKETNMTAILKKPEVWNFGKVEADLEDALLYSFQQLAKKETDLEENYLSQWTGGYTSHDVMIALKQLINDEQIASYELEDTLTMKGKNGEPNIYTFFTLYENRDKQWGAKQFKQSPIPPKKDDTDKKPE